MKNYWKIAVMLVAASVAWSCSDDDDDAFQPAQNNPIEVRGSLIDVRTFTSGEQLFPQHKEYTLPGEVDKFFSTPYHYAVGLKDGVGVEAVRIRSDYDEEVLYIANELPNMNHLGWLATGKIFTAGDVTYHIHWKTVEGGEWITLPRAEEQTLPTMVLGRQISVDVPPIPGVVITRMADDAFRDRHLTNNCILILPDGSYLASCTNVHEFRGTEVYRSVDKGQSWELWSEGYYPINFGTMFLHRGQLYLMGVRYPDGDLILCPSSDKGKTWLMPEETGRGVLLAGNYHSAPVPVVEHDGRIWRALESRGESLEYPFVISAPADSDLLDPANWTRTNIVQNDAGWTAGSHTLTEAIEGNVVIGPQGEVYNLLRGSCSSTSSYALLGEVTPTIGTFEYNLAVNEVITMPGGGKKFTVRYDEVSKCYWAITNPAHEAGMSHSGIYANGITFDLMRNHAVLCYSKNLVNWVPYKTVVFDEDPFFHGYQYFDWVFDGDDIVAVSRTACPEERGLPVRQHDANMMTFHRIPNFRTL